VILPTIESKTLYGSIISPYVRKVAIVLDLKCIDYTIEVLVPFIEKDREKILQMNPLGKIPVYQDNTLLLSDSSVICAYLEKKYPDSLIYPVTAENYAACLWYEEYADSQLIPTILTVAFNLLFAEKFNLVPDLDAVKNALDNKLPQIFTYLDHEIGNKKYFINNCFSLADISIAVPFLNFEIAGHRVDPKKWNNLSRYLDEISNEHYISKANALTREKFKIVSTK
jgi:glutathione S-transferase